MKRLLLVAALAASVCTLLVNAGMVAKPCADPRDAKLPFCDASLPLETRVADLVSRLPWDRDDPVSLNITASLLSNDRYVGSGTVDVPFLPSYNWRSNAIHGVSDAVYFGNITCNTIFPQVCTTGATFNKDLFVRIGDVVGKEGRAMTNLGHVNYTFWGPDVNVYTDPRWGRGQEIPGEDPYLVSAYASRYVRAMQNNSMDPTRLRVSSCCKHLTAYNMEEWGGIEKFAFDAIVSEYDMYTTFMPPFETCVHRDEGHASGIMCSYNAVNGVPMCANKVLMTGNIRNDWGFEGYIVSDSGASEMVFTRHHYGKTAPEAAGLELEAGMDLESGNWVQENFPEARKTGLVRPQTVKRALANQLSVLFRLGYFDPWDAQPFTKLNANDVNTKEAQGIALQAAQEGVVLLHNKDDLLPFHLSSSSSVAVMGPNALATTTMLGNYLGEPPYIVSPLAGVKQFCNSTSGCQLRYLGGLTHVRSTDVSEFPAACKMASEADYTVLVMGNDVTVEREGKDRVSLGLPGVQDLFINHVASCARNKSRVAVVVLSGGSVDYSPMLGVPNVGAVLWGGYPGQSGGQGIADVLFGAVSPSGRLPHTVYFADFVQQVSMLDMQMTANKTSGNPGRTYRYFTGQPVFPFGWGLTFTKWKVEVAPPPPGTRRHGAGFPEGSVVSLHVPRAAASAVHDPSVPSTTLKLGSVWVNITNVGKRAGGFSCLLFVKPDPPGPFVNGTLSDFEKVFLQPGESKVVELGVNAHAVTSFDPNSRSKRALRQGKFHWHIADGPSGELHLHR